MAMMNVIDKELIWKKIKKTPRKKRLKTMSVSKTYSKGSYVWVSNYIKIIDK